MTTPSVPPTPPMSPLPPDRTVPGPCADATAADPDRQRAIRVSYDTVAADYAQLLGSELAGNVGGRAALGAFAELLAARGGGRVADLGCGPGRVAAYLHELSLRTGAGLDLLGIDLSPGMVAVARARYPHLTFAAGTMTALDLPDTSLAGALSWYSTVHTPDAELPAFCAEFFRVLAPGGLLLLGFKTDTVARVHRLERAYGHDVDLDVHVRPPDHLARLLTSEGFVEHSRTVQEPGPQEKTPQGFLIARKPA